EVYWANVTMSDFDVGVKKIHIIINPKLTGDQTPATMIKNITVRNASGTLLSSRIFVHEHWERIEDNKIFRDSDIEVEITNVNTTKDPWFNLTIKGLELEFELTENTWANSIEINNTVNDIQTNTTAIKSDTTSIITTLSTMVSDVWNFGERTIHELLDQSS
ncbi:unnamed protein product, partial [marine sediment metagenome]